MSVVSRKEYIGVARDRVENFNGNQLVYVGWDNHLLFASAFLLCPTPETVFRDLVQNNLAPLLSADPDAKKLTGTRSHGSRAMNPGHRTGMPVLRPMALVIRRCCVSKRLR